MGAFSVFTGSLSGDSIKKEKLISSYGETAQLKAETGNSYCESILKASPMWLIYKKTTTVTKNWWCWFISCTDGSSGVVMKDKATYAGKFHRHKYWGVNWQCTENLMLDWTRHSFCRDSQGQRHLRRRRTMLLFGLLLLLVEVAAGPSPSLPALAGTPVWPHCSG